MKAMIDWALVPHVAGLFGAILLTTYVSFLVGVRHQRSEPAEPVRSHVLTQYAAMLGLLGLLLAFTLAMAEARFVGRRALIVDEANAIGTTYLRAEMLPEAQRAETRTLLRRYTAERIAFYEARGDARLIQISSDRSTELLGETWALAVDASRSHPESEPVKLYVTSLNQTIDLEATRMASLYAALPRTILGLLLLVALIATGSSGYTSGLTGHRGILALYVVPTLVGLACLVVIDLDHPRVGFIRANDYAMERLYASMKEDAVREATGPISAAADTGSRSPR